MSGYVFIYKDSMGYYNTATNMKFVAKHKACVAIEKSRVIEFHGNVEDLIHLLNHGDYYDVKDIVAVSDLWSIL